MLKCRIRAIELMCQILNFLGRGRARNHKIYDYSVQPVEWGLVMLCPTPKPHFSIQKSEILSRGVTYLHGLVCLSLYEPPPPIIPREYLGNTWGILREYQATGWYSSGNTQGIPREYRRVVVIVSYGLAITYENSITKV